MLLGGETIFAYRAGILGFVAGGPIHVTDRVPLALLPGLLTDRALWAHQIEALADLADSRVADFTTQGSIVGMARSVLDMMPARFALAGLSMGGYVALEVLRQAPERVGLLALLDTKARLDSPARAAARKAFIAQARTGAFKGVSRWALEMYVHPDRVADAGLVDAVLAMTARVGRDAFLSQQAAIMDRPRQPARIAQDRLSDSGALRPPGRADAGRMPRRDRHGDPGRQADGDRGLRPPEPDGAPRGGHHGAARVVGRLAGRAN